MMRKTILIVALVFSVAPLSEGQESTDWTSVLIPVMAYVEPLEGAYGTTWRTGFKVYNSSEEGIPFFQGNGTFCRIPCSVLTLPPGQPVTPPIDNFAYRMAQNPSVVFFFPKEHAESFWFYSDVREEHSGFFTPVPVVRETDYRTRFIAFPAVPTPPSTRILLRLYGIHNTAAQQLEVTVHDANGVKTQEESVELLVPPQITPPAPGFFDAAAYAALPIEHATGPLLITITTESPLPIWAMVTITDNVTQDVRIVTPE